MGLDAGYGIGSLKPGVCTSSTRPASPYIGQTIFETDTNRIKVWLGTAWSGGTSHNSDLPLEYLVIAGGGGGGYGGGGGGGAGGYLSGAQSLAIGTYTVTVGAGGAGDTNNSGTEDYFSKGSGYEGKQ